MCIGIYIYDDHHHIRVSENIHIKEGERERKFLSYNNNHL